MKINAVYAKVGLEDLVLTGGPHDGDDTPELASPSDDLLRLIAGAEASGSVEVLECTDAEREKLSGHVQTQEDAESAREAAVANGTWREGNLQQFVVGRVDRLAYDNDLAKSDPNHPDRLSPVDRARFVHEAYQALALLREEYGDESAAATGVTTLGDAVTFDASDVASIGSVVPDVEKEGGER